MKQPACENIELQKHPWVRGCVNGAFSAGTDPGPVLLTDGQQMAFCVQLGRARGDREGKQERGDTELMVRFLRTLQSGALYAGLKCLITRPV